MKYVIVKFRNSKKGYSYKWRLSEEPDFSKLLVVNTRSGYSVARLLKVVSETDPIYNEVVNQATEDVVATFIDDEYLKLKEADNGENTTDCSC
jgi:pilus assembly protein TadC